MKTQKFENVSKFVTHTRAHKDELCGLWQFYNFGHRAFQGVSEADVQFIGKDWGRYPKGVIPLGIGFGEFDEHRQNGRLPNTCTAMLVARRLGTEKRLEELLAEVLWCDTNAGVKPTRLANLIKAKHRVNHGDNQNDTMRWSFQAFDAIAFGQFDPGFDIRHEWDVFTLQNNLHMGKDVLLKVKRLIVGAHDRREVHLTELASIGARMNQNIRGDWLNKVFRILIRDAQMFDEAVLEIEKKSRTVEFETEKGPEPMCIVQTDNELVSAAFAERTGMAALLVARNSAGHTCVLLSPGSSLPTMFLAAMIRMAEYKKWTGRCLRFEEARCEGTLEACPQWHLASRKVLLNGSLTHPEVSPSKLTLDEIAGIVPYAYNDAKLNIWLRAYYAPTEALRNQGFSLGEEVGRAFAR